MERFKRLNGRQKASPKRYREESVAQFTADIDNRLHEAEEQPICTKEQLAKKPEEDQQSAEDDRMDSPSALVLLSETEHFKEQSTQTDMKENETPQKKKTKLRARIFGTDMIQGNDSLTKFYTGLPTFSVFLHVFMYLSPFITPSKIVSLLEDEFLSVLVRLRLNLTITDLACRLGISPGLFQKWLDAMSVRLSFLITWPDRETMQQNMPLEFQQLYPNCRVTIDCSEIFIETPSSYKARSQTYSNYKKHNTAKFLIGITPCGTICFLSSCWGGRVSDKNLTQESNFLNHLEPGDVVLADRGFTLKEDIASHGAHLEIPAFTRGKKQLSQEDVEKSKQLSKVRIHVERIIGLLKKRHTILKCTLPISVIKHRDDIEETNIDKFILVCSALTNLGNPIVNGCI